MNWNVGSKPSVPGEYWVVLISPNGEFGYRPNANGTGVENVFTPDGTFSADIATRTLARIDGEDDTALHWAMDGEPETGLVWLEETGSTYAERVYAWAELDEISFPTLPANTKPWWTKEEKNRLILNNTFAPDVAPGWNQD